MASKRETTVEEVSIIAHGVHIEGNIKSHGDVRVDGKIFGNLTVAGNLTIGESSEINGEVLATNITMSGNIKGKVTAQQKLRLESKAVLAGDIITKLLVIEEGAKFDGSSKMNNSVKDQNEG